MKVVVIAGSSRNDGGTSQLIHALRTCPDLDIIDLNDFQFSYYDYTHANSGDDFLPLMRSIIAGYDVLLFATPVYWYAMSGIMKVFFDRITDLITIEKDLGRKLRGKSMAAISVSLGGNLGEHFWLPFSESADYLGMHYLGHLHTLEDQDETDNIHQFYKELQRRYISKPKA